MLKYKSQWYGKTLIEADRFFSSSKLCSHCKQYKVNVKREDQWVCEHCETKQQRDENATKNLLEYEDYTKVGKKYIHKSHKEEHNSSKSQAELKNKDKKIKLPESSGEVKTVEKCKTKIIQNNNSSNFNEAVSVNLD